MQVRRMLWLGAAAALAATLAGCGGAVTTSGSSSGVSAAGASVVPADAQAFVAVDTDLSSSQWQTADHLLDRFPDRQALLARLSAWFTRSTKLDFERDVQPALGPEVDVAALSGADRVVGLTQPADAAKFAALARKADLVTATVDGWTAFSDRRQSLDALSGGPRLADAPAFQKAMERLTGDALAKAYVKAAGAELAADDDGIKVDGFAPGAAQQPYEAELLHEVPAGALLYVSFRGSAELGQALRQLEPTLGALAQALPTLGIVLANENALYVRRGLLIPEVTLVTQPRDPQQALEALDRLEEQLAPLLGGLPQGKDTTVDGIHVEQFDLGRFSLYYGAFDGKLVVSDTLQAFHDLRSGGDKLADDSDFKAAADAAGMPDRTTGFVYANLAEGLPLVEALADLTGKPLPAGLATNLRPLRTLVAYAGADKGGTPFGAFLRVG